MMSSAHVAGSISHVACRGGILQGALRCAQMECTGRLGRQHPA